jgi:hypothetical protein
VTQIKAHAHSGRDIEPTSTLCGSNGTKFGPNLVVVQDSKTEVLVQGPVPRHIGIGGQGDGRVAGLHGPLLNAIEEGTPETGTLVLGPNAHLFDMSVAVDLIDGDISHELVVIGDRNPAAARIGVFRELLERWWLVICD